VLSFNFFDQIDTIFAKTERESKASIYQKFNNLLILPPGLTEKFEVLLNINQYSIYSKGCALTILHAYESASIPQRIDFTDKSYFEFHDLSKFISGNMKKNKHLRT